MIRREQMYKINPDKYFTLDSQPVAIHRTFPEVNETEHDHDFEELVIVERGCAMHVLNGESHFIQTGDVFYINHHDYHYYKNLGSLCLTNILVRPKVEFRFIPSIKNIINTGYSYHASEYLHLGMRERLHFFSFLTELQACLEGETSKDILKREGVLLKMLSLLETKTDVRESREKHTPVEKILEIARVGHCEDIEWEALCRNYGISHRTLYRQIKELTGYTPDRYLTMLRLRTAKELIRNADLSISDIAIQSGFKNFSHFSRCYKSEYFITPSEEKKNFK